MYVCMYVFYFMRECTNDAADQHVIGATWKHIACDKVLVFEFFFRSDYSVEVSFSSVCNLLL